MTNIDTRNLDALAGAVYFTVGRGTEGGPASYRLSVAGVDRSEWGQPGAVAANSGYSIGAIQVDLGQRGTWPLGATTNRPLRDGETTYVDGIIAQAGEYARRNGLTFPQDTTQLRADLLSHGNGRGGRDTITFIDPAVRDSINAWAGSDEGKRWIHTNIDYPQVRSATETAMTILDRSGSNISEDRRFEAINILAKTANQYPRGLERLENVLREGGDYNALLTEARDIRGSISYYDAPKAASIAQTYEDAYNADPTRRAALDRAHADVARRDYDPSAERNNADVQQALTAIGAGAQRRSGSTVLDEGDTGRDVRKLEANLAGLGITDANAQPLVVDGRFTAETRQAVENYQRAAGLSGIDGRAGPQTLGAIDETVRGLQQNLVTLGIPGPNGQPLGVDGYLGDDTRTAVRTFQQTNGIDPTGIADDATRRAIETAVRERTQAQPDVAPTPGSVAPGAAPETPAPAPSRTEGPQSFEDVMRVMLPPQGTAAPHMTSDFGPRSVAGGSSDHRGVDFNYDVQQSGINLQHPTVRSPVSGVVVYGDGEGSYGTVKIRDDAGNTHEILHLDSRSVRVTDPPTRVEAGDPIGTMGGRGPDGANQYAQHVHYQLRDPGGTLVDPEAFWNNRARTQGEAVPVPLTADRPAMPPERPLPQTENAPAAPPSADPSSRPERAPQEFSPRPDSPPAPRAPGESITDTLPLPGRPLPQTENTPAPPPSADLSPRPERAPQEFSPRPDSPPAPRAPGESITDTLPLPGRPLPQTENVPAPPPSADPSPRPERAPQEFSPRSEPLPGAAATPSAERSAVPGATAVPPSDAMTDGVLRRHERGTEVGQYQRIFADLGYAGADGKPIKVDEAFGPNTEFAVSQFQRDHGIEPLGVIGPKTQAALEAAGRELITQPGNADNPLYTRMLEKVYAAEDERRIPHGEHSRKVAAALTVEAVREGIQPDRVELSKDGSLVRAVQFSAMGDRPELNRATDPIATAQAANQSIRESSEQAAQVANNVAAQQRDREFARQNAPQEQATPVVGAR